MRSLVALVASSLLLTACSLPVFFRVPVVQGNIVTEENVGQLELGMTKRQVTYVMGTPLVESSFERNRWDYVFYYRDPRANVQKSEVNLFFADGVLAAIDGADEYTREIMDGPPGLDDENPMPAGVTPGPNYEVPGPDDDIAEPGVDDDLNEGPINAPLPGY